MKKTKQPYTTNYKMRIQDSTILILLTALLTFFPTLLFAQDEQSGKGDISSFEQVNPYFLKKTITTSQGPVEEGIINGPPTPPPGYDIERKAVTLPKTNALNGISTLTVPAFNWVFGCSSVSGAMVAGYYDRNGYPNVYTGPTNGGVMPLNNSSWPTWTDGYSTYPNLPLAASHQGVDGRSSRGSIDDYWVKYDSTTSDPYITNGWTQHTWSDAIGDYMKTSQSGYSNTDGSTTFYNYTNGTKLYCADMAGLDIDKDGAQGMKLFYEARGYTVTECYNQYTDNNTSSGFTFTNFKNEIDAGHPVILNLIGHTIVGVGYDSSNNTVYIHDTWDYSDHTMTWGGSYSGMALNSVSVIHLAPSTETCTFTIDPTSKTVSGAGGTFTVTITASTSSCTWSTFETLDWLSASPTSGTGSGSITVTVAANTTGAQRSGTISLGGTSVAITQAAAGTATSPVMMLLEE